MNKLQQLNYLKRLTDIYYLKLRHAAEANLAGNKLMSGVLLAEADSIHAQLAQNPATRLP